MHFSTYLGNRYLHVSAIEKEFVQQKFSEAIDQPPMECPFVYTMSCILTAEKYKMGRKENSRENATFFGISILLFYFSCK